MTTAKAIRVHEPGGPDAMKWEDVEIGAPGPGEAVLRHEAVGVNFIDVYHRSGLYPLPRPFTPGSEGAGVVETIGPGVTEVKPGDRVAYGGVVGAYATWRKIAAERLVPLPDAIDAKTAAAMMLKGMTARYLLRETHVVQRGDVILVHAAAGGVGTILCQWAHALGAKVLGTVGSDEKAARARANGCSEPIVYTREDFVARTKEITAGAGVAVVYDGVGKDTFLRSLDCLRVRGLMVSFGQSSGSIGTIDPLVLSQKGSLYLTRPTLATYTARRDALLANARDLFEQVERGTVRIEIDQTYPLAEAARAHTALEARQTTGSTVLVP